MANLNYKPKKIIIREEGNKARLAIFKQIHLKNNFILDWKTVV